MNAYSTDHLPSLPCYLNGEICRLNTARISPLDRGFIFGDGIYEGIAVYRRDGFAPQLFRFNEHMDRLERGLKEAQIDNPHTPQQWKQIALDLIDAYSQSHAAQQPLPQGWFFYFQITRGVALRDHPMLPGLTPTVFATCLPSKPLTTAQRTSGVACVTADDFRWRKAHIKSISLFGAVMARQISYEKDALETIMFRDGYLSEAASSNVWVVKNGKIMGSPRDNLVLEGIRYGVIEEICHSKGIAFELRRISRHEVRIADELLLSSATKEIVPVTTLDGQVVGTGRPGPVYQALYESYQRAKTALFQP